jgi:hypothetical protein
VISIKELETQEQLEEQKKQLEEQTEEREIKRAYDGLMNMSRKAADKACEIVKQNDPQYDKAVAAIFDFEKKELRFVYAD